MVKPENDFKKGTTKSFRPFKLAKIAFPENQIKAAKWVHVLLWALLGFITVVSVVHDIWPHFLWNRFNFVNYLLHSTTEALGAIAAILVALMPLQVLFGKSKPSYVFLSTGFLIMGLLDLFHSFYEGDQEFVFTHALALLSGGFFFALFVFPWRFILTSHSKRYFLIISGLITITLIATTSLNSKFLPEMIREGVFTSAANNINLIAGILFLIGAVKLFLIYLKEKNLGVLILLFTAASSAIVGFTFQYSTAWSDSWWLWHLIRLIAFLALLGYMLWRIQAISEERTRALKYIKDKHNHLMESEERFSLVNEATQQGLWDWNVPKNEVYFSPVWKMQVGYKDDELENDFNNWVKLLHPEDKDRCMQALNNYLENPQGKFIIEFRFRHKDGHYVWIHNEAASVKDEKGNVLRMFGAHADISAQKEAEQKLKESEKLFRIIFENSPLGKSRTGLDGSLNINKAFSDITGYNLEELQGKHWKEITHPDDIQENEETIQAMINGEISSARFEKRYLHKAGHYVWTEVNTSLHRDEAGKPKFFITTIGDITKRKEAEQQIKQNEKKFRGLFESDPSAIFIADPQTGLLHDVNPAAEKMMEMSRNELIGLHQSKLHPEDILEEMVDKFKKLQQQPNVKVDSAVITKTGIRKPVEINVSMVEIDNKPHILGIFHDISNLVEQQQQLKQSQEKIKQEKEFTDSVINSMPGIFYLFNQDGKFLKWNNTLAELSGLSFDEVGTKSPIDFIAPPYRQKVGEAIQSAFAEGSVLVEADFLMKEKSPVPFLFTGKRIFFDNKPLLVGVGIDITRRRNAEQEREKALKELNERMKEITCLYEINEAIKNPNESIAQVLEKVTHTIPNGMQYPQKTSVKVLLDEKQYVNEKYRESDNFIEEEIISNNKTRGKILVYILELNNTQQKLPFLKEEKQLLSTIANNIGIYVHRVESARELGNAMEKLQRSNKELERFAYVASHDLQEPLRMVSSYTQLLERRYKGQLDERADKYIYYAVDGANRMQNLINDLLDISRVSTRGEKFEPFDTNQVLKNVMTSLSVRIEETGTDIKIDPLPEIEGDKAQIERVFLNLIANAIKFRKTDEKPEIAVKAESRKNKWLFTVKDNGIGIDEKFKEKVFVIFQRLHGGDKYKGTGIGLAICKRIVQRHGGEIWFESEEGKGTTFFFTINKHQKNQITT